MSSTEVEERFWSKVEFGDWLDCWLWNGGGNGTGYGTFWLNGKTVYAHRVAYELLIGELGDAHVDHVVKWGCGRRNCVNPLHLEPVTFQENHLRRRKTHCKHGHPLTHPCGDETKRQVCLTCRRATWHKWNAKRGRR